MIDPPLPEKKVDYWRTIFNAVVPDDNNGKTEHKEFHNNKSSIVNNLVVMKTPANLRYPKFCEDRKLGLKYSRAMQVLTRQRQIEERRER